MERFDLPASVSSPTFIGSWRIEQPVCNQMVDYFEEHQRLQRKGITGSLIDEESKNSVDITIRPKDIKMPGNEIFAQYFDNLFECYKDYLEQWPFLSSLASKLEIGAFNLQRYRAGQHFKRVHSERTGLENLHRVLVWMTYLNDVEEGGSTRFSHYDLSIKPQKGLTLIWPAEWTHAHSGEVLGSGLKYIATGWITFPN